MSVPRLLCVPRVVAASRRTLSNRLPNGLQGVTRWQSTKQSAPRGFRAGRFAAYTITTSGLALGAALAYGNYDPVFKNQVDEYVPGFARLTDTAADLFVDRTSSVRPHGGDQDRPGKRIRLNKERMTVGGGSGETRDKKTELLPLSPDAVVKGTEDTATKNVAEQRSEQDSKNQVPPEAQEDMVHVDTLQKQEPPIDSVEIKVKEEPDETGDSVQPQVGENEHTPKEEAEGMEGVKGGVERAVEEVREEVERVAEEVREEKVREQQEAQMADQQLSWLKDSAQVEEQLEQTFQEFVSKTSAVTEAQKHVVTNSQEHARLVKEVTSNVADDMQNAYDTADAMYEAEEAVKVSREALKHAMDDVKTVTENLKELQERAMELGLKSKVEEVEMKGRECMRQLEEGAIAMRQVEDERELLQDYQRQAQRDREQLQRELGQDLPEGDSRQEAVLVMLGRRVEVLKQKLQELEKEQQERLTAALERQRANLEEVAERRLTWGLRDKEREMQQEISYQVNRVHSEYESELREQLKRQADTHNQLLTDALNTQAEQLAEKWSGELEFKLTEQETHYQKELALVLSRLRGIEYMVNTIAAAGHETKRQQGVRAACDSLHTALQAASASPDPDQRYSLKCEVSALRIAAKDDPFILAVLDSLPVHAVSVAGIQGEGGLRERFAKVKRICRRVALVPERGGGMGTYALSYLQSLLIVSWRFVGRIRGEGETGDHDLDPFAILERAETCMRQGDIESAVRYVNLLRGESRNVARDWLHDARSYLETAQAVRLMSEYIAALNITASTAATQTN